MGLLDAKPNCYPVYNPPRGQGFFIASMLTSYYANYIDDHF